MSRRWTAAQVSKLPSVKRFATPNSLAAKLYKSKAEERYAALLDVQRMAGEIRAWRYEAITFKLADGVRYTPDFLVTEQDGSMSLREVKGFMREAARVRLKIAVEMYPTFAWFLVWARKGGFETEPLP